MSITNYQGLRIFLRPGEVLNTYDFTVENLGDASLWNLRLDIYEIVGPSRFGLDDTHMKPVLSKYKTAEINYLPPGASTSIMQQKWSSTTRYIAPQPPQIYGTFTTKQDGGEFLGLRADFVIAEGVPVQSRVFEILTPKKHNVSRSYKIGQKIGAGIRKWFKD
ncbi:hypothetical protein AAKU61_000153 [Undibacterium sp. GrIS 1.2]|uniref:hypothetical protein n=1 Tax=Undibacterium sp. GrIS 1.2 TaxID=3143933 RepID=UPI0033951526